MTAGTRSRELSTTFRSMASDVELRVVDPGPDAPRAVEAARVAIRSVATHLTRFEATSALSRLNARPSSWHVVPEELAEAVEEAERAHRMTGGLFDPRVLDQLLAWGYDRTFDEVVGSTRGTTASTGPTASTRAVGSTGAVGPTGAVGSAGSAGTPGPRGTRRPWRPTVLPGTDRRLVQLDGAPIDLGGIGKGLASGPAARCWWTPEVTSGSAAPVRTATAGRWASRIPTAVRTPCWCSPSPTAAVPPPPCGDGTGRRRTARPCTTSSTPAPAVPAAPAWPR